MLLIFAAVIVFYWEVLLHRVLKGRYQRDVGDEAVIVEHAKYTDLRGGWGQRELNDKDRESDASV